MYLVKKKIKIKGECGKNIDACENFQWGKETLHLQVLIGFLPPELPEVRERQNWEDNKVPEQKHLDLL